jgi:hypothetical protein
MKTLTLASLFILATTMPLIHEPAGAYAVSVSIRPTSGSAYQLLARTPTQVVTTHVCSVEVTDLSNNTTLTGPRLSLVPGDKATKSRSLSGYDIDFTVSLSSDARHATSEVVLRRMGKVLTRQRSDTWLIATTIR